MIFEYILGAIAIAAIMIYLIIALIRPERNVLYMMVLSQRRQLALIDRNFSPNNLPLRLKMR